MNYYDNDFRKKLQSLLKTYRGLLTRQIASMDEENKNNIPLIESQIQQIDEALEIIKPSMKDMLTEKKIEKIQKKQFSKEKQEEIINQAKKEFEAEIRRAFTKEAEDKLRADLEPKIRADLEKKFADNQNERIFKQFISFMEKAFQDNSNATSATKKSVVKNESTNTDNYEDINNYESEPSIPID